ncbi:MAG: hypothetical protein OCD00_03815 [Colwellia sp.]
MKIIPLVLLTTSLLTSSLVMANCRESVRNENQQRLNIGSNKVVSGFLSNQGSSALLPAFQDITIAELNLITWKCLKASDPSLLLREAKIENVMDVNAASFIIFSAKAKKELGIDLNNVRSLFNTTIHLKTRGE